MLKVFVDSGSSIKQEEKEKYNVEIFPLKILLNEKEYQDGVDLSMETFYHELIENKQFPMTSLPNLAEIEERVSACTNNGDDVIIVTISSKISGTHNAIKMLFSENPKVRVIDSLSAVGGVRLILNEINKHRSLPLDEIVAKVNKLIPRIRILAIPETLTYLHRGGRLSKISYVIGSMLKICPIISFKNGAVVVESKKLGIKAAIQHLVNAIRGRCDPDHEIIASYTYDRKNLDEVVSMLPQEHQKQVTVYDNLTPAIAAHWGPNAFGLIFASKTIN